MELKGTKTEKNFYIADKEDNFKCNQYDEKGGVKENTLYVPTPQGYSLKVTTEDSFKEIFFISNQNKFFCIRCYEICVQS